MRVLAMSAVVLLSLKICDGGDRDQASSPPRQPSAAVEAKAEASATASAKAPAVDRLAPRIGGSLVTVGDYAVELLLFHDGRIHAHVTTREGMLVMHPTRDRLAVVVRGQADARRKVQLTWSKPHGRYRGEAGAELVPGPVDIELEVKGKVARTTFENAALAFDPVIGGEVLVAGSHGVELAVSADGKVESVVRDAAGVELGADAGASLEVDLSAPDASPHVKLVWDGARAAFVGRTSARLESGRAQVKLALDGKTMTGGLARLILKTKAAHGGRVIVAGDFSVELVAGADGMIQAFVTDFRGQAETKGDLELSLAIDGGPSVKLDWDAPSLAYRAKLGAGVDLAAKPLRLTVGGCCGRFGQGAVVGLSAEARVRARAGADLDVEGGAKAAAGARAGADANAKVDANAKASLDASKPKVDLKAKEPSVSAKTSTKSGGGKVSGKAGFSLGTKK